MTKKGKNSAWKCEIFRIVLKKSPEKISGRKSQVFFGKYLKKVIGNLAYPEMVFTKSSGYKSKLMAPEINWARVGLESHCEALAFQSYILRIDLCHKTYAIINSHLLRWDHIWNLSDPHHPRVITRAHRFRGTILQIPRFTAARQMKFRGSLRLHS